MTTRRTPTTATRITIQDDDMIVILVALATMVYEVGNGTMNDKLIGVTRDEFRDTRNRILGARGEALLKEAIGVTT